MKINNYNITQKFNITFNKTKLGTQNCERKRTYCV